MSSALLDEESLSYEDPPPGMFERYGCYWDEGESDLTIELACYRMGLTEDEGGLGKAGHFRNCVDLIWNHPDSNKRFDWHPWAERMLEKSVEWKYLGVAGCASSGKTDFYAVYSIISYLSDPAGTMVLVTSTSLKDSRRRIWGSITEYWQAMPQECRVGKLVDSHGLIKFVDPETGVVSERSGIALIAGDPKKEKEAVGKLIGYKRGRVILVADELPELSEAILEAALGNLNSNPEFQLIGIGNPASHYDAFGVFCKPKEGWKSITALDDEWETDYGWCIRFDGLKAPNVVAREEIYPWMLTEAKIEEGKKNLGENSPSFWRMYRGFWCPTGSEDGCYSEGDIIMFDAQDTVFWKEPPTRVAALDASFSANGDRAVALLGNIGETIDGLTVLQTDSEYKELLEDVTKPEVPRNFQIAQQFKELCEEEKVTPFNAAVDSTGAGGPFCDILAVVWSADFLRVYFGGVASDRQVAASDERTGKEAFSNRMSEIWMAGKAFLRSGQLKGLPDQACKEMVSRLYKTRKKNDKVVIEVEPKPEMKARIGKSPDVADTVFILLDLARERHGIVSTERSEVSKKRKEGWEAIAKRAQQAGASMQNLKRDNRPLGRPKATGFISLRRLR